MKKLYIITVLLVIVSGIAQSQRLIVKRTDVDSARTGFVTSTQTFGVDIVADSVKGVSAVSFSLSWTNNKYVKFSEWKVGYLGDSTVAYVYPEENKTSGMGVINVGVSSGEPEVSIGYDNPIVIHFEFVVTQSVPNGEEVVFTFQSARANVNDSIRKDISLNVSPVTYNIHSFMDVWPGDADNNGVVNYDDILPIDKFFDYGSAIKSTRTFKRPNASTYWTAQRVLAWDNINAAYADCDGNGVVNEADVLVVAVNSAKTHSLFNKKSDNPLSEIPIEKKIVRVANSISVPITINHTEPLTGVSGRVCLADFSDEFRIIGLEKAEYLNETKSVLFSKIINDTKCIAFALISDESPLNANQTVIANLILEPKQPGQNNLKVNLYDLRAVSSNGYFSDLNNSVTAVSENINNNELEIVNNNGILKIVPSQRLDNSNFSIFVSDCMGREYYRTDLYADSGKILDIDLKDYVSGVYFLVVKSNKITKTYSFIVY